MGLIRKSRSEGRKYKKGDREAACRQKQAKKARSERVEANETQSKRRQTLENQLEVKD